MNALWRSAPALFYGILFFLGAAFALAFHWSYLLPLAICLASHRKQLLAGLLVCLLGYTWALFSYALPQLTEKGVEGKGTFTIESVSYAQSPFQRSIVFKGVLKEFSSVDTTWKNIPCRIHFKDNKPRPEATTDLRVEGRLIPKSRPHYVLKVSSWEPLSTTYTLAQWRFDLKTKLRTHLNRYFPDSKSRAFLLSMVTGEVDDRLLALEFNRLGILHLLGISGFQFALLAFLLGSGLRLIFTHHFAYILLIVILSAYAFALGDSPPIERAWLGTVLYLIALLCGLRVSARNALGLALLWQLIKDPLLIYHLGFQFSFLCTAAILVTYPLFRSVLSRFFPRRSFRELIRMSLLDQHGHLLSFFCRETLALNGAIHLVTLPLIFFHFHKFPVLSLLYNLFLPAAVSIVYLLLVLGIALSAIMPPLGAWIYLATQGLTSLILKIATHPPALYDFQWRVHHFPMTAAIMTMSLILVVSVGGSLLREKLQRLVDRTFR